MGQKQKKTRTCQDQDCRKHFGTAKRKTRVDEKMPAPNAYTPKCTITKPKVRESSLGRKQV